MNLIDLFEERRESLTRGGAGGPWILIFDVDSTLMDTGPRNEAILEAAFESIPDLAPWKGRIPPVAGRWNILDPCREAGMRDRALLDDIRAFWQERFFTDRWVTCDRPYPGAAACLEELKLRGFCLVYLTGRHSPGMEVGTRASFEAHGLPAGAAERFFFKPSFDAEDQQFKLDSCAAIGALGTIVGTLDNEPGNVNLFVRNFPGALNLWMRTITSPRPETLVAGSRAVDPEILLPRVSPGAPLA